MTRREWIYRFTGAAAAVACTPNSGHAATKTKFSETLETDPPEPGRARPFRELLTIDEARVESPLLQQSRGVKKDAERFARQLLELSREYARAHVSRQSAPEQVEQYLNLFPELHLKYPGGKYVPFCAAGISFAACRAYCESDPEDFYNKKKPLADLRAHLTDINQYYFKPSPAVRIIRQDAIKRGSWTQPKGVTPKTGWLVVYSWHLDGTPNHIGLVDHLTDGVLHTVEYNTSSGVVGDQSNGGAVAERTRDPRYVLGYVKTY